MNNVIKNPLDITIIGAGPVGCYAGYLLAKQGHAVSIYENHAQIGAPIQCTGILTSEFDQFNIPTDEFLVNTINKIEVFSPNKKVEVHQKDYIVCRTKFDQYFGKLAQKAGARIFLSHSFQRKEGNELVIKDIKNNIEKRITPDIVIAADGPLSPTAKAFGFYHPKRKNYFGVQATVEGSFDPDTIKTYFGNDVCPGLFAWVTPESSTHARVGLAAMKDSRKYFEKFIEEHGFTNIIAKQAGTIPFYEPHQLLQKDNCYLVGDASTYVKATTLGGIVPAMKQVQILVDSINQEKNNAKSYIKNLAPVRKQMWTHLMVQKILMKFSDKDFDRLVEYVSKPAVQKIFEKYTRDNPIPLVTHTLLREPRFLRFMKYLV